MSKMDFCFDHHVVNVLPPVADFAATSVTSDFVSLANYGRVTFVIATGLSTSDTSNGTVTVLCGSSATGGTTALAFKYRVSPGTTSSDIWGALTDSASTGFTMSLGDNFIYTVEVTADSIEAQAPGKYFVAVKVLEVTNDPVVGGIIAILSEPRYELAVPVQAIA